MSQRLFRPDFNISGCVPRQSAHHHQPDMVRPLKASRHKNLNLPEVSLINYIDINRIDVMEWLSIQKENLVMRAASIIARYLAGVIFLVFGLNGFLNFIRFLLPEASRDSSWALCTHPITCG